MRTPRLYVEPLLLDPSRELSLQGERLHYLTRVLRRGTGDAVQLFDGQGRRVDGVIRTVDRTRALIEFDAATQRYESESNAPIELAIALLKGDALDEVLHGLTELGVDNVTLLETERSEGRLPAEAARAARRLAHWQGVLVSACEQCGRDRLPTLAPPVRFGEWLLTLDAARAGWLLQPSAASNVADRHQDVGGALRLVIGPEGGWSDEEQRLAHSAGLHALALPTPVLRARIAPIAALAMVVALRSAASR